MQGVAQSTVVAGAAAAALLPRFEDFLGILPRQERFVRGVAQVHAAGEVQEDAEVGAGFAGWFDSLQGEVHGAVGVGEGAALLTPAGGGQHYVGELGRLGREEILDGTGRKRDERRAVPMPRTALQELPSDRVGLRFSWLTSASTPADHDLGASGGCWPNVAEHEARRRT